MKLTMDEAMARAERLMGKMGGGDSNAVSKMGGGQNDASSRSSRASRNSRLSRSASDKIRPSEPPGEDSGAPSPLRDAQIERAAARKRYVQGVLITLTGFRLLVVIPEPNMVHARARAPHPTMQPPTTSLGQVEVRARAPSAAARGCATLQRAKETRLAGGPDPVDRRRHVAKWARLVRSFR